MQVRAGDRICCVMLLPCAALAPHSTCATLPTIRYARVRRRAVSLSCRRLAVSIWGFGRGRNMLALNLVRAVFSLEHHIMLLSFSSRHMHPRPSLPSKHFILEFLFADAHAGCNKWCPTSASANGELGNPGLFVSQQQRHGFQIITNKHDFERVFTKNADSELVINILFSALERIQFRFNSLKQ